MAAGLYAGTTLADDGRPVLLLDPPGIAARAGVSLARKEAAAEPERSAPRRAATPYLLFRTLAGAKRMVEASAAQRIEEVPPEAVAATGGRLRVAVGGALLALEGCDQRPETRIRALRLTDGNVEIAYAVAEVLD